MKYLLLGLSLILGLLGITEPGPQPKPGVPVLCYHGIYTTPAKKASALAISREQLDEQLRSLQDSGYNAVLPDQLLAYLTRGHPLPRKPIIITFDDTRAEHLSIAAPLLEKYNFRGVFFIMTVPIGKPGYMTAAGIKALSDRGHVIGAHTWDHPRLNSTAGWSYTEQIVRPRQLLEKITGKQVLYFAYPFGEWNESAISLLQAGGFKAAFQLTGKTSGKYPQYTIRRIMVDGRLSGARLQRQLNGKLN